MFNILSRSNIEIVNITDVYNKDIYHVSNVLGKKYKKSKKKPDKLFILDYKGDVFASQAEALSKEISILLSTADPEKDKVLVRLESPGGTVNGYGYAASQLERIRKAGFELIVAVDKVSASGGYLMACVANKILASPFAIIGSIGVVAEFPNFSRLLESLGIDYKEYTAGKDKRTVGAFAPIRTEGEDSLKEDLKTIHNSFKEHIQKYRKEVDLDLVASGKYWPATVAKEYHLVDEIKTSEEFILESFPYREILKIKYSEPAKKVRGIITSFFVEIFVSILNVIHSRFSSSLF